LRRSSDGLGRFNGDANDLRTRMKPELVLVYEFVEPVI